MDAVREVGDLAARLRERLALLGGEHRGELAGALLDQRRGLAQDRRALLDVGRDQSGSARLGRLDRQIDVVGAAARDRVHNLLGGRVDDFYLVARGGLTTVASDQHLLHVGLLG